MSFKDDKETNMPFHSDHKIINRSMPLKYVHQEKVVDANTEVGQHVHFHDHTYRTLQTILYA